MAWALARYKTAVAAGSWTPADLNAVQDQYVRATGILATDFDPTTVTKKVGLTQGGDKKRGKVYNAASELVTTGTGPASAPTPDKVSGIVLETDGLLLIYYRATIAACDQPGCGTGTACVYMQMNGVGIKIPVDSTFFGTHHSDVGAAGAASGGGCGEAIATSTIDGLQSGTGGVGPIRVVSTGEILTVGDHTMSFFPPPAHRTGGPIAVFAAAGTYDIEAKYGWCGFCGSDIYAVDRYLAVEAIDFS